MATTLTRTTSQMRWTTGANLVDSTLTFFATRGPDAPIEVPVSLDLDDPTAVIADISGLEAGTYLVQLRAVRLGVTAWFPPGEGEELTISASPED